MKKFFGCLILVVICMNTFQAMYAIAAKITIYNQTKDPIKVTVWHGTTSTAKNINSQKKTSVTAPIGKIKKIEWGTNKIFYFATLGFRIGQKDIYINPEGKYKFEGKTLQAEKTPATKKERKRRFPGDLVKAISENDLAKIEQLIKEGASPNEQFVHSVDLGAGSVGGQKEVINYKSTPLEAATGASTVHFPRVKNPNFEIIQFLLKSGAKPSSDDLARVVKFGLKFVDLLASHNAPIKDSAFIAAMDQKKAYPILDYLFKKLKGAKPTEAVINVAANKNDLEMVKYFAAKDIIPTGETINKAILKNNLEMVETLVKILTKKDIAFKNKQINGIFKAQPFLPSSSPLDLAVLKGDFNIVKFLVANGADVDLKSITGTPLHSAIRKGHLDIVKFLVEKGADVNNVDSYKLVPLDNAAQFGHLDIVKFLVKKGANVNLISKRPRNTINFARQKGFIEIAEYLESQIQK